MNTKALRQKILNLAIHGKLVPQDPNDEPASVLLERIRAEKERLIKEGKIKRPKKTKATSDKPHYPYELPEGWAWCKLSDCCHIAGRIGFRGYTKDDLVGFQKGAITLSPSNIIDGEMDYNKCTYISWDKYEESPEIEVLEGDILLVKTGSSFGKCALVDKLPWKSTINPQFVILKYISINEQYLTWVLQSSYARNNYNDFVLGTAIPTFTQVVLGNMPIPLPPISEQLKIVKKLKHLFLSINSLEDNKKSLCTLIKESKSKVLDLAIHGKLVPQNPADESASELLKRINPKAEITCDNGHYQKLPEGWCITPISEMCENINGLWKGKKEPFVKVGVIRNANFTKDFKLDYSKIEYIDVEERAFKKRHLLNGDLIVEKSGGSDNNPVGRAILYEGKDAIFSFSNFTMVLRILYKDVLSYKYLYYYIMDKYQKGEMRLMQTQTTGLHNLILDKYLDIPLCLPPYQEQQRIINKIEEIFGILNLITENL